MIDRNKYIGGYDAGLIMSGDWNKLYRIKTGLDDPEDLSMVFPVQLGAYTEEFHLNWIEQSYFGEPIINRNEFVKHRTYSFIAGHCDGVVAQHRGVVEAKHVGGYEDLQTTIDRYTPQMAHYCAITDHNDCFLSVIQGNREPVVTKVSIPQSYIDDLIQAELKFWDCVVHGVEPDPLEPEIPLPETGILYDDMRVVDMSTNNAWGFLAAEYFDQEEAAKGFNETKKDLKVLIDDDVKEAYGYGLKIKRDKRGSLRFSKHKETAQDG